MYYHKYGKGTSLVLLHGFCETSAIWEGLINELSTSFEVIVIDLPGFGASQHVSAPTSISQVAEQVHDLLKTINVEEYFIAGHSLGGYVSLELAQQYPSAILGIGLINSTAYADDEEKRYTRIKTIQFVEKRGVTPFINSFVPQLFANNRDENITSVINIANQTPLQSLINYTTAMMLRPSNVALLKKWDKPFFFFAGTMDALIPIEKSRNHLNFMDERNFHEHSIGGHMGMYESSEMLITLFKASFINP